MILVPQSCWKTEQLFILRKSPSTKKINRREELFRRLLLKTTVTIFLSLSRMYSSMHLSTRLMQSL